MTAREKDFFKRLIEIRQKYFDQIQEAERNGTEEGHWNSVVDKYSDQAHFIYEILQNADDAGATQAAFELYQDRLVFRHNGKRRFTISNPDTYQQDKQNGTVGDINSITAIGASSKSSDKATIGKFGVGFKAVFQYTLTPHIYDDNVLFKIHDYIVPQEIEVDYPDRKKDETIFVFPFDHPETSVDDVFKDISHKLCHLVFPTLFLNNVKKIKYRAGEEVGEYTTNVKRRIEFENTTAELIFIVNGSKKDRETVWMFTREEYMHRYSCGFFVNKEGNLTARNYHAFCFFPTKKDTNLNFIINAPFLLTDSREGIKAANKHNIHMIDLLSDLAGDSFLYLRDIGLQEGKMIIDDDILSYIPVNEDDFIPQNERDDISFYPFYKRIKETFEENALLPSFNDYVYPGDAYIPYAATYADLFSNKHLARICEDEDAEWVLPTIGWETLYRAKDGRADYLRDLISPEDESGILRDVKLIDCIDASFIESQTKKWLLAFYDFVIDTASRVDHARNVPIFINPEGHAVAAYDENDIAILFIDEDIGKDYETISEEYLQEPSVKKLVDLMGITAPELKDKINNKILRKEQLNPRNDFRALLSYFIELEENGEDTDDFIWKISDRCFIYGEREDKTEQEVYSAEDLYYPSLELKRYFEGAGDVLFVCVDKYKSFLSKQKERYLEEFLTRLGVLKSACVIEYEYTEEFAKESFRDKWERSTSQPKWLDKRIEGDENAINHIVDNDDMELSVILWNQLVQLFERPGRVLGGTYRYYFRTEREQRYEGIGEKLLREKKWLFDQNGDRKQAKDLSLQTLNRNYDTAGDGAKKLLEFLRIKDEHPEYESLPESVRVRLEKMEELEKSGFFSLTPEVQAALIRESVQRSEETKVEGDNSKVSLENGSMEEKVLGDIRKNINKKKGDRSDRAANRESGADKDADSDEITRASVDYSKRIEKEKQKCEDEITRLAQIEELQNRVLESKQYSYRWFSSLLQLEAMSDGDENINSREVSISFSKVEREPETSRTLILKHPDKNIPAVMEELVDIPLDLTFSDGATKRLIIEVANVQSYILRVKVKKDLFLLDADFSMVNQARIVAQSPAFLMKELQKQFAGFEQDPFNMSDDYDMQQNLCENIQFIFGPPGTGKSTYLATEILTPMVRKHKRVRTLVLTPTNKAADVLTARIIENAGNEKEYENWLVRYGVTIDEDIEKSPVFHGKEFEIEDYDKCVIITTIARLCYDYFIDNDGNFNYLRSINWDYIVVDEASMIPLIQMVYMLYAKKPKGFIIAGDPFQIEPTSTVSQWKNENIYTMVHLNSFSEKVETVPHQYDIKLLTTQYRSIESIGEVFSQLTYEGVLKHARSNEDARPLNIEQYLDYENLNIIRFPVREYESIYRSKRLKRSSYHVYAALFAYEFSVYIAKALVRENPDETFRIGIISPYGAQAGMIDKLLASAQIPTDITVSSGTIHGFQGDECDIIIALFNPPPYISSNREMFLNRQNIVNVAISRARDYLFVLLPDEETKNVENLALINKLTRLIEKDIHKDQNTREMEELMFGNEEYLEENSFSTGHQLVNVYGLPERRYEIRSEENAVDVQVYGETEYQLLEEG